MLRLTGVFSQLSSTRVLVIGDLLLDTYTIGKARRISPEAPVAVVHVQREEHRPGGAGNVIVNLISLSATTVAVGRIGDDSAGKLLLKSLQDEGVDIRGILIQPGYSTPVKNRILAENQQIVRVDWESIDPIPEMLEQQMIELLPSLLEGVAVVAISDYGKGLLSRTLLSAVIELSKERGIPVIADPKGIDFAKYNGSTILKPNLGEAYSAANLPPEASLEQVAVKIHGICDVGTLMVTRSEAGISLFHNNGFRDDFPVKVREIKDVTGAGDTVLAMLTAALANKLSINTAVQLSNVAAGIAIERFGCARVSLSDLARRLLEEDVGNKIFDGEHLFALKEAVRGRKLSLLSISGEKGFSSTLFSVIRQLAKHQNHDLLIHVGDATPDPEFIMLLASLHEVNFILLKTESLKSLSLAISPDEVYLLNQGICQRQGSIKDMLGTVTMET